jgi:hypothetical protein
MNGFSLHLPSSMDERQTLYREIFSMKKAVVSMDITPGVLSAEV